MRRATRRRLGRHVLAIGAAVLWSAGPLPALVPDASADEITYSCGIRDAASQNNVFSYVSVYGINPYSDCGVTGLGAGATSQNTVPAGRAGGWRTTAPSGLTIVGANVPFPRLHVYGAAGTGYVAEFYWDTGAQRVNDGFQQGYGWGGATSTFGFQLRCAGYSNTGVCRNDSNVQVDDIALQVHETQGPSLVAPDGLWQQSGWVRGSWPVHFYGDSPSGLCGLSASLAGQAIPGSTGSTVNPTVWHQCAAPAFDAMVNTAQYGQGGVPLVLGTSDAAGVPASATRAVLIDNSVPIVSISGPTDAPSTAGTQYVTATASALSGVAGLSCSVDGGAASWHAGSSAQVPVTGVGQHTVACSAENNAVDSAGNHGWSPQSSWSLKIGYPTVTGIGFSSIVNALRCGRERERVRLPARWVTVRRGHKLVRVRKRAGIKIVKVMRCHPRIARRRVSVWTTVRRHGKKVRVRRTKTVTVPLLPRAIMRTSRRVAYGRGTVVSGWLGLSDGTALTDQVVRVLSAPDNGLGQFSQVAVARTDGYGGWSAQLPPGPSRLVQAVYDGSTTTESSSSAQVRVVVPAVVRIRISPTIVPWGSEIRVTGQVLGGYVPTNSNLLRLNVGIGRIGHLEGLPAIQRDGRFVIVWKFDAGHGVMHPWFSVGTLSESAFPYAPGTSRRVIVTLGMRTPIVKRHHPAATHRKAKRKKRGKAR
jgi:hypothetical protein